MNKRLHHHSHAVVPEADAAAYLREFTGSAHTNQIARPKKRRVTIALSLSLLERLRNAVYWTGQGTMARLINEALDDAVTELEQVNGGAFPVRLAPLKRGRPRLLPLQQPRDRPL